MAPLMPELAAWSPFEQLRAFEKSAKVMRQHAENVWTDRHSWFAITGGFAVGISDAARPQFLEW